MMIRPFRAGDEPALHAVFHSAVHEVASRDYAPEQIDAWAPSDFDADLWARRMRAIAPFVVEDGGQIVGYADLQTGGLIDHFYVSGAQQRRGVGGMLMQRIHEAARAMQLAALTADVSRTAEPFFARFGFRVVSRGSPVVRGVVVPNARMRKDLVDRR